MAQYVYLASPIDAAQGDTELAALHTHARWGLRARGFVVFDPRDAWAVDPELVQPDGTLQHVNEIVLRHCDALVALLPEGARSIGVPLEILEMSRAGRPILVLRGKPSWPLASIPGVMQFVDIDNLLDATAATIEIFEREHAAKEEHQHQHQHALVTMPAQVAGEGPLPVRHYDDDAGFDLFYHGDTIRTLSPGHVALLPAGVAVAWPPGVWGFLVGRSSAFKLGLLVNPAVIDPGFRGDLYACIRNISNDMLTIQPGERIAQVIPLPALAPNIVMERVPELAPTQRGTNGFGSTGR